MFKGRIAHGMLTASFTRPSSAPSCRPGLHLHQPEPEVQAPVRIGDTVKARVTVTAVDQERARITVATVCHVGETQVTTARPSCWCRAARRSPGRRVAAAAIPSAVIPAKAGTQGNRCVGLPWTPAFAG